MNAPSARKRPPFPAWLLLFLAPVLGELLSSSAPPAEFFNPGLFILLTILYGGGAILVRELTFRWNKGWASLLILGVAYGIIEEGLMVKSFFNPDWMDLGQLNGYDHWLGVNWTWSIFLTIYHATFSIATPILLVDLIFPAARRRAWLKNWVLLVIAALFVIEVIIGFKYFGSGPNAPPYRPPAVPYLISLFSVVALVSYARDMPHPYFKPRQVNVPRPRRFWLVGFLGMLFLYLINFALPSLGVPPVITILFCLAWTLAIARYLLDISGHGAAWNRRHKFGLAAGVVSFFILVGGLQEFNPDRADNPAGMLAVAALMALFLLWANKRIKQTEDSNLDPI